MRRVQGFTLVELVLVMTILAILSVGTVQFIRISADSFGNASRRLELAAMARATVDRMARELRDALPQSARVAGNQCLELVPVLAASTYLTLPLTAAANSFQAVPMAPGLAATSGRVVVYPSSTTAAYSSGTTTAVGPVATLGAPDGNNEIAVSLAANHQFPAQSPTNRFFLVDGPVSFCVVGSRLYRYSNYSLAATQPLPGSLPSSAPDRALLADSLDVSSATPFTVLGATLTRNALVRIDLPFVSQGESVRIDHEVQLRNVP